MQNTMNNTLRGTVAAAMTALLAVPATVSAQLPDPADLQATTNLPLNDLMSILRGIMQWALAIVAVLAVIGFVLSGILYLTAAGDEDQIGRAKRAFFGAVFGVIVSLLGLIVLQAAQTVLSGEGAQF